MNQEQQVIRLLAAAGSKGLSGLEAEDYIRCRDLPKRISVLRQRDFDILSEMKRDNLGQRYARYYLAQHAPDHLRNNEAA